MKTHQYKALAFAGAGLLSVTALLRAQEAKPAAVDPKSAADFLAKVTRDSVEVRNSGQVTISYADVVQKILPSVVSIGTYSKSKAPGGRGGVPDMEELEQLPPMFREFFRDWLEKRGGQPGAGPRGRQRPQQPQQTGLGSGVILTEDGYILTNNHVVENADELKVTIGDKAKEYTAKVIGADPATDVALIKVEGTGLPHATFGDSSRLRVGDIVLAVGSPMGLDQSVTHGIVSALGRSKVGIIENKGQAGYENFIQTDAAINPGNSGGPLVDALGRVVGINTAIETRSGMFSGIGLAIPINMALGIVSDLLDDGKVDRGYLGVAMSDVDPSVAELFGLKDESGVTVSEVRPGSPAEKAGFQGGDVIVSANGETVLEPSKLRLMISSKRPGEPVKFGVVRLNSDTRKPERFELSATLGKLTPELLAAASSPSGGKVTAPQADGLLKGVQVEPISDELRQEFAIAATVTAGLVVTTVDENSDAARKGLQEGDVIVKVNNQPVSNLADARSKRGGSGDLVHLTILREGQTKFMVVKG